MIPENLNIGLILQYNLTNTDFDADELVKQARNYGFRGVEFKNCDLNTPDIAVACKLYGIELINTKDSLKINNNDNLSKLIKARLLKKNAYFSVNLTDHNQITEENHAELSKLRKWIDSFGHAFYNARPSSISSNQDNIFVLENHYAPYQIYVFIESPLPEEIILDNCPLINHASWIDTRKDLDFKQKDNQVSIELQRKAEDEKFEIYALRIQLHRPEDDIETKF